VTARDPRRREGGGTPLGPDPEREAEWEIRHHVEERTDQLVEEGWERRAARREAERRFGDAGRVRRELVDMGRIDEGRRKMTGRVESVVQDVRYALRGMRRSPGFAVTVCLTLGIGIGAAGAIFSVVDAVMLRPLPYERPEEIVEVSLVRGESDITLPFLLADQVEPYRNAADFFEETAYSERLSLTRTDAAEPEVLSVLAVSPGMDELLGMDADLGRLFGPDDAVPGAPRAIVLSHGYWRRIGADPGVLGTSIRLEETPWTVVGVLPPDFKYPVAGREPAGWIPFATDRTAAGQPVDRMRIVGRLASGVTLDEARSRAEALAAALESEQPHPVGWSVALDPVTEWRGNDRLKRGLWLLSGAVGLMLAIALANGVNILLVRATTRRSEMAVRRSVGASRLRLLEQTLTESVLLALVGGAVAVVAAAVLVAAMAGVVPDELTFSSLYRLGLERRALVFVFATATVGGIVVGLPAALAVARRADATTTQDARAHRSRSRIHGLFVVGALGLSVALLSGATTFARSFQQTITVDPGVAVDSLAFVQLSPNERAYETADARWLFLERVVEEIAADPRVGAVTVTGGLPPDGGGIAFGSGLQAEFGEPIEEFTLVGFTTVEPDFERVLGVEIVEGRALGAGDAERRSVMIDRDLARLLFGEASAVGRRFRLSANAAWQEVVGVVDEIKLGGLDDETSPYALLYPADEGGISAGAVTIAVRAAEPAALLPSLRAAVRRVDPRQPVAEITTAGRAMTDSLSSSRFLVLVMSGIAAVATFLAAVGVYGVLSYTVSRRRREMGIQMAIGASRGEVRRGVLATGAALAATGGLVGVAVAFSFAHLAEDLLFRVQARDPASMLVGAGVMFVVSLLACWIPARRATRVDPVEVLRTE